YFAKFDWPRITNPKVHFPLTNESMEKTKALEVQAEDEIKNAFHSRPDEICCILLETIQGEGGDNFFRKEFLQRLKSLALENDALLIFDEVQTGFGFTGKRWAFENFDVQPDLIAFGKKVQVCGCAVKMERLNEVENVFKVSSRINSTWGGNLTDMVRCTKFIEIIAEENLIEHAKNMGEFMLGEIQKISEANQIMSNPRGLGLWMAFDMPSKELRDRAIAALYINGLMILPCGQRSIRIRPVLDIHKNEAEEGLEILRKTLSTLA
ncbi:MAG: L-lysine 6-transaminase, partial [Bdellovibrio sp. CG10_big_fil_rev_8_21_14_0_10_47_8]